MMIADLTYINLSETSPVRRLRGSPPSESMRRSNSNFLLRCMSQVVAVRPEGAHHQWRRIPPGELSIDPEASERLGRVTGRAEAS